MSKLANKLKQGLKDAASPSDNNLILEGNYGAGAIAIDGYYKFWEGLYNTYMVNTTNGRVRYLVEDGDNFEIGTGVYYRYTYEAGISVRTPEQSLSSGTASTSGIALGAGAIVSIIPARQNFSFQTAMAFLYGAYS